MKSIFSRRLIKRRKELGMTVVQLADACGLTSGCISQYENGIRVPGCEALFTLASALNLTVEYLLGRSDYSMKDLLRDDRMYEMLEGLPRLPDEKKEMIFTFFDAMVNFEQRKRREVD